MENCIPHMLWTIRVPDQFSLTTAPATFQTSSTHSSKTNSIYSPYCTWTTSAYTRRTERTTRSTCVRLWAYYEITNYMQNLANVNSIKNQLNSSGIDSQPRASKCVKGNSKRSTSGRNFETKKKSYHFWDLPTIIGDLLRTSQRLPCLLRIY